MAQDLIIPEHINAVELYTKGGVPELLHKITDDVRKNLVDVTTEEGREACRSFAYKIARSKTLLDDMGKDLVEDWKRKAKVIDADRKVIRDTMDALKDEYRRPLTDWENAEKDRIERLTNIINNTMELGKLALNWQAFSAPQLQKHLEIIKTDKTDYMEFSERAEGVKAVTVNQIIDAISKRTQYDADQAELKRLREEQQLAEQVDREARIAAEAKEAAERKAAEEIRLAKERADKAESDRKAAEEKAEREKKEAAERAEKAAKDAAAKAEKDAKDAADKAEREKAEAISKERERVEKEASDKKAADDKRAADTAHRAVVHNQAVFALADHGIDEKLAHQIVELIELNKIPNLTIVY